MNVLNNIFENLPADLSEEFFDEIISGENFKLEKIISRGHSSPENFWYDQDKNEFVILLSGSARIVFDDGKIFELVPGDYLIIEAHQKHRIDWTDPEQKTFWLALHY